MTSTATLGITFPVPGLPLQGHADWLRAVEAAGYTHLWSGEAMFADAFAMLSMATVVAPSMHVGTAIVPAFTRSPGLLAVSAATLACLAPGRCSIGVGASSIAVVQHWGGGTYDKPYQRTRDVVRFLREALTGSRVTQDYSTFSVRGYRLQNPPPVPPKLLVAALRPGMLGMAGRESDGAVLTWVSPDDVRMMAPIVRAAGAEREVLVWVPVCPSRDAERVRDMVRPNIAEYLNVAGYAAFQEWAGRGDALRAMSRAWAEGRRRDAVAAVPDSVVDELVVHGSPATCRERLQDYSDAGASSLALSVMALDGDLITAARELAPC